MATNLGLNLDEVEKAYLGNLSRHEGFKVLQKIGDEYCRSATAAVIKLDPTDDKYEVKLRTLQTIARVANDFCSSFFATVEWSVRESLEKQKQDELESA
jgi:hypothetical protein